MIEFFSNLFSSNGFMPHGHCLIWQPEVLWLHVVSDIIVAMAYFSIPISLSTFVKKRKDLSFRWVFVMFGIFILACGTTHLLDAWTMWNPAYRLEGIVKAVTALASIGTAITLWPLIPKALAIPSPAQLEIANDELQREVIERKTAEEKLQSLADSLEVRIKERTKKIEMLTERLVLATESAEMGIWDWDTINNKLIWDERMYSLYGISHGQFGGAYETWKRSLYPEDRDQAERDLQRALDGQEDYDSEFRILWPNQSVHYIKTFGTVQRDGQGKAIRIVGINMDITRKKHAEKRFELVVEATPSGMVMINNSGNIELVNAKAEEMFGYPRAELYGQSIEMLVPERLCKNHPGYRQAFFASPETRAMGAGRDLYGLRKNGTEFPVEIGLNPVETEEGKFVLSSVVDITERKKAEEEIREYAKTLEKINSELDEFTYVASHDLQEPIRNLISYSALLKEDLDGELSESATEDLYYIIDAAKRMKRLVEDLLSLSKTRRYEFKFTPVSLSDCVDDALQSLHSLIHESDATIHRDSLPEVIGDHTYLSMLYQNLIGNAIKFRKDPPPVIHLTVEKKDEFWILGVQDNGIGIKDDYLQQIFAPFKRLHGLGEYEGTGIGLAICRKAVERHGGSIWVESEVGKGAHFKFTIPYLVNNKEVK